MAGRLSSVRGLLNQSPNGGCHHPASACVPSTGTGTFGRVFLVKDKKTRGFFALKAMKIPDVIRLKQEQHVHNEKEVLTEVNHPFLIRL